MSRMFSNVVVVFTLLLFTVAVPIRAQSGCPTDATVDQGKTALDAEQYKEAITVFSCVIETDPQNASAYIGRAEAYVLNGDWWLAFGDYRSASLYVKGNKPYGQLFAERFNELIYKNPRNPAGYIFRAHLYWYAGQDTGALKDYDSILAVDPSNLFALTFRGSSRLYLGIQGYEDDWAQALELAPKNPSIPAIIAATYRAMGDPDKALEYANRALKVDPKFASGYMVRGRIDLARGEYLKAVDDFNHSVELGLLPTRAVEALSYLGETYLHLNRSEAALASFERAEKTMPGSPWVGFCVGESFAEVSYSDGSASAFLEYAHRLASKNIQGDELRLNEPMTIALDHSGWNQYSLPVELKKGQVVQFEANSLGNTFTDPLIVLLSPQHKALAANDQLRSSSLNAVIQDFTVPYNGLYTLLVTSTLDGSAGRVQVRFSEDPGL